MTLNKEGKEKMENKDITEEVISTETEGTKVDVAPVEETTLEEKPLEVTERRYTQAELDEIVKNRLVRETKKHERIIETKYKPIIDTLSYGTGTNDLDEIKQALIQSYEEQGVAIPKGQLSEKDEEILAKAYANEIISIGKEDMEYEANRIASIPYPERTPREKIIFNELGSELTKLKAIEELESKGVKTDILQDTSFKAFASKFNPSTSIAEIYEMYEKTKVAVEPTIPKPMGSVKDTAKSNEIKEYYTQEEIRQFSQKDLMTNPKLMEAVENSLARNYKK